jgi:hypothetical protein
VWEKEAAIEKEASLWVTAKRAELGKKEQHF